MKYNRMDDEIGGRVSGRALVANHQAQQKKLHRDEKPKDKRKQDYNKARAYKRGDCEN